MLRRVTAVVLAVAVSLSTACTAAPIVPASERLVQQARRSDPPEGKANIYVIRGRGSLADRSLWIIDLDFKGFGTLGAESYLYGWIDPGDHVLAVLRAGQIDQRLRFTADRGRSYFFNVVAGLLALQLERIDDATGRELIGRSTLSGDNRFEAETPPPAAARRDDR